MSPLIAAFEWQTVAAGALVGLATAYLTRRYWKAWTSPEKRACGGGCGSCSATDSKPLVTLTPLAPGGTKGEAGGAQKKASGTA
jgi:hypothetical protein